jgi:hypothetical protein
MADRATTPDAAAVERLYQLRPDAFVAARDELAKALRTDGQRDAANAIKALRKPSVSAWAVNRLAADEPDAIDELFGANERLRAAMAGSGKDTSTRFRAASGERQRIVARLVERTRAILEDADLPAGRANLDRIASTLMASATDEAGAASIRGRVLDHDLSPAGGFGEILGAPSTDAGEGEPAAERDPQRQAAERKRQERAERDADERKVRSQEADRVASEAEREADDAEREAERVTKIATARRHDADRLRRDADHAADLARTAVERLTTGPHGR